MAYAAYRETFAVRRRTPAQPRTSFHVLDVTVPCAVGCDVRRCLAGCPDVGVVRCEPLLHAQASAEADEPCVRLMVRLPLPRYAEVLHRLMRCVPRGEIGRLISWREHLARCGLRQG